MTLPNLVIVVMDCVRASDFPGGLDGVPRMPNTEALRRGSIEFPRSASVATWTVPAHASLFTGLYPWEHGDHGRRSPVLNPAVPTLAKLLHRHGYRSGSFSANALICPVTGLTAGFDFAAWGSMSDLFLRLDHREDPPHALEEGMKEVSRPRPGRRGFLNRIPFEEIPIRAEMERRVVIPAAIAQLREKLLRCNRKDVYDVARWIEPAMDKFVGSVPSTSPLFCFVNLLDAHEPYFPDPEVLRAHGGAWAFARLRQDRVGWLDPHRVSDRWNLGFLHDLYLSSIRRIDRRIGRIIEVLKRNGRWENTFFLLTSDHGQAFGEHGMLFHRFRADDALLRIPMLARMPGGRDAGRVATGWASLVDVAPTVLSFIESRSPAEFSGVPLTDLIEAPRAGPVFALHDGTLGDRWVPESRRAELERIAVAAFRNEMKVVVRFAPEETQAYDLRRDPGESTDVWDVERPDLRELAGRAQAIGRAVEELPAERTDSAVQHRLESWGYV